MKRYPTTVTDKVIHRAAHASGTRGSWTAFTTTASAAAPKPVGWPQTASESNP